MEKDKYYTPNVMEIHLGFECEVSDDSTNGWQKAELSPIDVAELMSLTNKWKLRVKYLDREDIESFGFKHDGKNSFTFSCYTISGQLEYQNIEIEQNYEDVCMGEWKYYDELIFRGKIKNKSEFSRLLKQLSII